MMGYASRSEKPLEAEDIQKIIKENQGEKNYALERKKTYLVWSALDIYDL